MNTVEPNILFWGLGLAELDAVRIQAAVPGCTLRNWPESALPGETEMDEETPFLIWIPMRVWERLDAAGRAAILEWDPPQKVLVLDPGGEADLEAFIDMGFLTVLRRPLAEAKITDTMRKAGEVHSLYEDIMRMTREIALEREILSRKTDYLLFLNSFMARVSESLNPATIVATARKDLAGLMPVTAAQGIFWQEMGKDTMESEIFLAFHEDAAVQEQWIELLLGSARRLSGAKVESYQLTYLMDADAVAQGADLTPRDGRLMLLPLKAGGRSFGCLALLTGEDVRLTRQQRDVLNSAVSHLGLALKNALLYREVKLRADHDGLTRIYNRHYFDERIVEELSRAQRYGQDISLLILDLDHFKAVNDTHGHQAGDTVLKDVGQLLQDTLRSTDFAARYGGEEFCVILPHTGQAQALLLAERLRAKVQALRFCFEGRELAVTASIGVASLTPGGFSRNVDLVREADRALYLAKERGRNQVCLAGECGEDALRRDAAG